MRDYIRRLFKPDIVEVPKIIEKTIVKTIEVPKIINVVEKVIEKVEVPVIVEKIVTQIVEVPVDRVVIKEVIKEIKVPYIVEKEKIVEVPRWTREIVAANASETKTCESHGHDPGRVKQWPDGNYSKCRRCGVRL